MNPHQRYLIEEFVEDYRDRRLGRRDLLRRVLLITGSIPATASILTALGCGGNDDDDDAVDTPAAASTATASTGTSSPAPGSPTDPAGVQATDIRFAGPAGELIAHLARPASSGAAPAVVVIHENRGLTEHIKDIARRYAGEGFVALAIDLVSRNGGTQANASNASGLLGAARVDDLIADLRASEKYLNEQSFVRAGAVGVTGFCFGGGYTWELAIASSTIRAAVPYYGQLGRPLTDLSRTNAAILAIYAQNDTRITNQAKPIEAQLVAAGKTHQVQIYPGTDHAFFNDTGSRYNAAAATDAWKLTLEWFRKHLAG